MDSTSVQNGATPVSKMGSISAQFSVHNYPFPFLSFYRWQNNYSPYRLTPPAYNNGERRRTTDSHRRWANGRFLLIIRSVTKLHSLMSSMKICLKRKVVLRS